MIKSNLISYFKKRLFELYHFDTVDSYRVRHHNSLSIAKELRKLISGLIDKSVKKTETLKSCIEEAQDIIDQDPQFKILYITKDILFQKLHAFCNSFNDEREKKKNIIEGKYLIYSLDKIISFNEKHYAGALWDEIEEIVFKHGAEVITDKNFIPNFNEIDRLTGSLAREILNKGNSKTEVLELVSNYLNAPDSQADFNNFRQSLSGEKLKKYLVILSIRCSNLPSYLNIPHLKKEVSTQLCNIKTERLDEKEKGFLKPSVNRKFYVARNILALDNYDAIKCGIRELYAWLDNIHLGMSNLETSLIKNALVIEKDDNDEMKGTFLGPTHFKFDGKFPNSPFIVKNQSKVINKIKSSSNIDENTKIRIEAALRHLRMGNTANETEQKFINYWIALEFIFSSPSIEENTFTRLLLNLTNILSTVYAKRNLLYFEKYLQEEKLLKKNEKLTKEKIDEIYNITSDLLIKYRLKVFKSRFFNKSQDIQEYIAAHKKNLERHLRRIYFYRNMLIHEAAINQDIEDLTSNLRYYLVFLLEQLFVYFSDDSILRSSKSIGLEDFFYEYKMLYEYISSKCSLEKILEIPVSMKLIN